MSPRTKGALALAAFVVLCLAVVGEAFIHRTQADTRARQDREIQTEAARYNPAEAAARHAELVRQQAELAHRQSEAQYAAQNAARNAASAEEERRYGMTNSAVVGWVLAATMHQRLVTPMRRTGYESQRHQFSVGVTGLDGATPRRSAMLALCEELRNDPPLPPGTLLFIFDTVNRVAPVQGTESSGCY